MPEVLSIRRINIEFADLAKRKPLTIPERPPARAPGLHQSDILKYAAVKTGKMVAGERLEEEYPWIWALGQMWEEFYFSLVPSAEWQPGELVVDDIAVNCDGLSGESRWGEPVVEETKFTQQKFTDDADFILDPQRGTAWMRHHQGRAYCYCYGPRIVCWSVMHIRGDYGASGPICAQYTLRFSESEVKQTWQMLRRYQVEMESQNA